MSQNTQRVLFQERCSEYAGLLLEVLSALIDFEFKLNNGSAKKYDSQMLKMKLKLNEIREELYQYAENKAFIFNKESGEHHSLSGHQVNISTESVCKLKVLRFLLVTLN